MNYKQIIFSLLLLIIGCNKKEDSMVGINKNFNITIDEIDSSIAVQLYFLRQQALNNLIDQYLINDFIKRKNNKQKCYSKERLIKIKDSLRTSIPIKNNFYRIYGRHLNQDSLDKIPLNYNCNSVSNVDFIVNTKCTHCSEIYPKIKKIIKKYEKRVNFNIVFYENEPDTIAAICFTKNTIKNRIKQLDDIYLNKCHTSKTTADLFPIFKKLEKTKQYLQNNYIYTTPSIIIDGLIIDDPYCLSELQSILSEK